MTTYCLERCSNEQSINGRKHTYLYWQKTMLANLSILVKGAQRFNGLFQNTFTKDLWSIYTKAY